MSVLKKSLPKLARKGEQKFCQISMISEPKCVSIDFEKLLFFD